MRTDTAVLKASEASQINAEIAKLRHFADDAEYSRREAETLEERLEIARAMESCAFELQGLTADVVARLSDELARQREEEATVEAEAAGALA